MDVTVSRTADVQADPDDLLEGINFADVGVDAGDDSPDVDPTATGEELSAAARRPAKTRSGPDRPLVRRTAAKTVEIAAASPAHRRLLAGVLGCSDDVATLTTEVMCAPRGATSVVSDLEEVAGADPMEAGVIVASWERPRSSALWGLLADLGAVKGNRPPQDAKAAIAMARAALGLSEAEKNSLAGAVALARKN